MLLRQQIHNWFKNIRKSGDPSLPTATVDLTGNPPRKPPPLQPHQAYSVQHHRADDAPLRAEVEDLWVRRQEQGVIDTLTPFSIQEGDLNVRLHFHNAVMRWKCSLLTEDESSDLQEWIESDAERKWTDVREPWRALQTEDTDELTAENQYVQKYVSSFVLRGSLC